MRANCCNAVKNKYYSCKYNRLNYAKRNLKNLRNNDNSWKTRESSISESALHTFQHSSMQTQYMEALIQSLT
jgi:hypothetical protein